MVAKILPRLSLGNLRRAIRLVCPETVSHDGVLLLARHMWTGGKHFLRNGDFLRSSKAEAERLITHCALGRRSRVLDVGCGPCRLPIGILETVGDIAAYRGTDVNRAYTDWGTRHIGSMHPTFRFIHLDLYNARYNRRGKQNLAETRLPFEDFSFDIISLYSVFSHLLPEDIEAYLREFRRLLTPGGKVFFTAFVEENVPDIEENPEGYHRVWKGKLHCVRYEKRFFERMLSEHGFGVDRFAHGEETDGQSAYHLSCGT